MLSGNKTNRGVRRLLEQFRLFVVWGSLPFPHKLAICVLNTPSHPWLDLLSHLRHGPSSLGVNFLSANEKKINKDKKERIKDLREFMRRKKRFTCLLLCNYALSNRPSSIFYLSCFRSSLNPIIDGTSHSGGSNTSSGNTSSTPVSR